MPPKPPSTKRKSKPANPDSIITDTRFSRIQTDPRFQLPSKKHSRVKLDSRFARVLQNDDFARKATVDRYGRKVAKDAGKRDLERFYRLEDEGEEEDEGESGDEGEETELDDDDEVQRELARVERKYDPARDGGFESSSSEDESSDEEEEEETEALEDAFGEAEGGEAVEMGEVSSRIAIVNLDWDNIRAVDLMAVANSFVPADGRLLNVTVYPSEFGRERMEREELEGPPKEIFQVANATEGMNDRDSSDSESETEEIKKSLLQEDKGEEFNSSALRAYQLERLKYYYAVLTCSSPAVGQALYEAMDGREYLSSANFFDMRFIPDEVSFDGDKPRDKCDSIPEGYKPNEFVTDALTHSKVKLTWDADDNTRKEAQKRAFSRQEIDGNDLQAYIGSDSSDDEVAEVEQSDAEDPGSLAKPTKASTNKSDKAASLRAALGLGDASSKSKKKSIDAPVGDMQITFTSGLSASAPRKGAVFSNDPPQDETTLEKYKRKEKERKERRKERSRLLKEGVAPDAVAGAQSDSDNEDGGVQVSWGDDDATGESKDPFDDPFFNDPVEDGKKSKKSKKNKKQRNTDNDLEAAADSKSRDELDLLMAPDSGILGDGATTRSHFDAAAIEKAEKKAKKKGKNKFSKRSNGASTGEEPALQKDFKMDVSDPRFARLLDSPEYAIDPTNPRYEGTQGMKALLDEGRKRRRDKGGVEDAPVEEKGRKQKRGMDETGGGGDDVGKLVERVKKRAKV